MDYAGVRKWSETPAIMWRFIISPRLPLDRRYSQTDRSNSPMPSHLPVRGKQMPLEFSRKSYYCKAPARRYPA
jgi:hypothetical protein